MSQNGDETAMEEKNLRDKGRERETERENCKVRGAALCRRTNVNSSRSRGWTQRVGEWRSATLGAFRGQGGGDEEGGPYETFQWSFITMGWWFTFIRPAAKSLVCI